MLADRCLACRMTTVLIPSVGICVHPWLFASRGLTVTATDSAGTAVAALSEPGRHPNLYSSAAYERWDVSGCAAYALIPHPNHFDGMPALEDDRVREPLRQRISFVVADWARLPVPSGTVDLVFATNAIPRESDAERVAVLEEWVRVLRPGGFAFIAQHHAGADWGVESFFLERGFGKRDFLSGADPTKRVRGEFQIRYSSG
jgi:SAM-dependent methyltransferase